MSYSLKIKKTILLGYTVFLGKGKYRWREKEKRLDV